MLEKLKYDEGFFEAVDGIQLYYQSYVHSAPKAIFVFVHGLSEHSGRYQNPLKYFSQYPYSFYLYDQRGHGKSEGLKAYTPSLDHNVEDLYLFIKKLKETKKKAAEKIVLVGHSFGGQVTANYLSRYSDQVDLAMLSSPNLRIGFKVPALKEFLAMQLGSLFPKFRVKSELDPYHISRDPKVVQSYVEDDFVFNDLCLGMAVEIKKNIDQIMDCASQIKTPILMMHGAEDKICDPTGSEEFFSKLSVDLSVKDKKLMIYDEMYHEIFNEFGKEQVFEDMQEWLEERL